MSSSPNDTGEAQGQLGLMSTINIIVGIVIGTSIFMVPQDVLGDARDPVWGLMVWVIGGLLAFIGALCYAELATTYPRAGGDYFFLSKGFGPATGFLFGWAQLAVVIPASIGAMAYAFSEYFFKAFFPDGGLVFEVPYGDEKIVFDPHFAVAAIAVLVVAILNILGVLLGKTVQNLLTIAKVIGLGAIIVFGFYSSADKAWEVSPTHVKEEGFYFGSLAMILVMYAFGGWNDSAFVAAEVRDPKRNIPRALFIGVAIIVLVYVLVNAGYINNLGWDKIREFNGEKDQPLPAQVIANSPLKEWGSMAISIIVMISALGAVNGLSFTGARVYAALGADHRLFGWMGYWRPGFGTPIMALILQAVLTVFILAALTTQQGHEKINEGLEYVNQGLDGASKFVQKVDEDREIPPIRFKTDWQPGLGFRNLVDRTAPVFWFFFLMTGLSLFLLRERFKDLPRPFSVPLYPLVPIIFCCSCAWMLYRATIWVEWHALFAVAIVLLGYPLYWLSCVISGGRREGPLDIGFVPASPPPEPPKQRNWK